MLRNKVFEILEDLSNGKGLNQLQNTFNLLISELEDYLKLESLSQNIIIKLIEKGTFRKGEKSILDFGIEKVAQNNRLKLLIGNFGKFEFLPFIMFREACYCFIPEDSSEPVKIFINQIVENNLKKLSGWEEWKTLIRDSLVNSDFFQYQFDKLQKFFKIEASEPLESSTQFFFKEIRENLVLSKDENIERFYDIIFERFTYKTSRTIFNSDIIETLRIMIQIFYENKLYLNLLDYQKLYKNYKQENRIISELSLRKFAENIQWINRCTSIAPSYDIYFHALDLYLIIVFLRFNPLLEKSKIKSVIDEWPFCHSPKFSENSFTTDLCLYFNVPRIYLNDFLNYFEKLEELGYVISKNIFHALSKKSIINLNYFKDISNIHRIIDPNDTKYESKYEIETTTKYQNFPSQSNLSIFDFILINRVRNLSVTGLTFDKRIETLNEIKEDIENELRKQKFYTKKFKDSLSGIFKYKQRFLDIIRKNEDKGFFNLYSKFSYILRYIEIITNFLKNNPEITNIIQFKRLLDTNVISHFIEEQLYLQNKDLMKIIIRDFLPLYFDSKTRFNKELEKIENYYDLLKTCDYFKIFDLRKIQRILIQSNLGQEIYQAREKRYNNIFKSISLYKITNERIDSTIEMLLNCDPPILEPLLINTILTSTFAKFYPELILKDTQEINEGLKKLKSYFPRIFIYRIIDMIKKTKFVCIETYFINIKEKGLFLSILYSYFKDSIIEVKRYYWRGVRRRLKLEPKEFYDFENRRFFYSEDLFKQLLIFSQEIFGKQLKWPKYSIENKIQETFWFEKQKMAHLINLVKERDSYKENNIILKELDDLSNFRKNLERNLLDISKFKNLKSKNFFQKYVKSINFIPRFQKFGFSQYSLYFRPFFYKSSTFETDFRLLFINSFLNIKYPACIEPNQAILTENIFPFRTPNISYLNWLLKSKKNVSEYCLFFKKKFYEIIHYNRNLTKEGWSYSSIRFKSYTEDVLFHPDYKPMITEVREFDLSQKTESSYYGHESQELYALTQIYNTQSIDIKSYLGTKKYTTISYIKDLLKKKLIFPYLSLKSLDFEEKISIIIPNLKKEFNEELMKIFSFFNVCHIYEIEGEFYIYGFEDVTQFENGLLIEIWFPKCELDEFFEVFYLIFEYFKIKHYLILTDLVDGKNLLKSVYGDLKFLDEYNPLKNLIWNDKDKIWMNHKLFNEKFEPIYPDLLYGNKREEN